MDYAPVEMNVDCSCLPYFSMKLCMQHSRQIQPLGSGGPEVPFHHGDFQRAADSHHDLQVRFESFESSLFPEFFKLGLCHACPPNRKGLLTPDYFIISLAEWFSRQVVDFYFESVCSAQPHKHSQNSSY
jgi:hypothetical protein